MKRADRSSLAYCIIHDEVELTQTAYISRSSHSHFLLFTFQFEKDVAKSALVRNIVIFAPNMSPNFAQCARAITNSVDSRVIFGGNDILGSREILEFVGIAHTERERGGRREYFSWIREVQISIRVVESKQTQRAVSVGRARSKVSTISSIHRTLRCTLCCTKHEVVERTKTVASRGRENVTERSNS